VDAGLSSAHEAYLAAGGLGFQLGDGKLNYGNERILETYYARQFNKYLQGTVDFQLLDNPGYNQDRGPVPVLSFRIHFEF
jgi:high affinity Mn2+ porin